MLSPGLNCATCWKNATAHRKPDDESDVFLRCYLSEKTPMGCRVSHAMHPELDIWLQLLSMIGGDTSIAEALPLLDRAGATEEDLDVILMMRSWRHEAKEELDRQAAQQKPPR